MRLPGGTVLRIPGETLALAIAEEWQLAGGGQGGKVAFDRLPLTRLAGTAQLRIAPDPDPVIEAIARYGQSDVLCYRGEGPSELATEEDDAWQPWLDWAAARHEARLTVVRGITHIAQPPASLAALHRAVAGYDAWGLAGIGLIVPVLGSLILGLALAEGALDPETAFRLACLDELHQEARWGEDADAVARRALLAAEVADGARFMRLSGSKARGFVR